jgi:hypothetical protein
VDTVDTLTMLRALYPRIKDFGVHDNGSAWVRLRSGAPDLFLTNDMLQYTIEQLLKKVKAHDDKFSH